MTNIIYVKYTKAKKEDKILCKNIYKRTILPLGKGIRFLLENSLYTQIIMLIWNKYSLRDKL